MIELILYLVKGFSGPGSGFMWVVLIMGCIAIGIVISRLIVLFKASSGRQIFLKSISQLISSGSIDKAIALAKETEKPIGRVFAAILEKADAGEKAMNRAADAVFLTESPRLSRTTPLLSTIANLATLTGLLGTVYGLIMSFDAVANVPAAQRAQALANGISVAMNATLFGLFVAIPCLAIYGIIMAQTEKLVEEMDEKAAKLVNILIEDRK